MFFTFKRFLQSFQCFYLLVILCACLGVYGCSNGIDDKAKWSSLGWKTGVIEPTFFLNDKRNHNLIFPTDDRFITTNSDGEAKIWNANTGEIIAVIPDLYEGPVPKSPDPTSEDLAR